MVQAVACIVLVMLLERTGLNAQVSTIKSWLQNNGMSNADSSSMNQTFMLIAFSSCFLGAVLAESFLGRYKTVAIFGAIYAGGCCMVAAASRPSAASVPLFLVGYLALVAPGNGAMRPNVNSFAADQIDPSSPDAEGRKESLFMYLYLTLNVGVLIAFGFLASVATGGLPPLVAKKDGFCFVYVITAVLVVLSLLLYVAGTPLYRKASLEKNSSPVVGPALRRLLGGAQTRLGKVALLGWALMPLLIALSLLQAFFPSDILTGLSLIVDLLCVGCLCVAHRNNSWLGQPDAVTRSLDVVPAILVGNLTFNVLYNTMFSLFYSQACQMNTRIGSSGEQLSAAFFSLGSSIAVIVFTPFLERCVFPRIEKALGRHVSGSTKVLAGMSIGMASQLVAAGLELARRGADVLPVGSNCAPLKTNGEHVDMSDMSAFWMTLPYAMMGIGEVLVNPVLQHVAYKGADPSMRTLLQALCLFSMGGLPSAVSSALTQATARFTPNDLNNGNLPMVYVTNVAFCTAGCIIYIHVAPERCGRSDDLDRETPSDSMELTLSRRESSREVRAGDPLTDSKEQSEALGQPLLL